MRKKTAYSNHCSPCLEEADGNDPTILADVQLPTGKCHEGRNADPPEHTLKESGQGGVSGEPS